MSIRWNDGYDPAQIAAELQALSKTKPDGTIGFENAPRYSLLLSLLRSAVNFGDADVPEIEQHRLVSKAVSDVTKINRLTHHGIKAKLTTLANDYVDLPAEKYTLLTSITVKQTDELRRAVVNGHTITFSKERPARFERLKHQALRERRIVGDQIPTDFTLVRISCTGRTMNEAAEKALESLDLLRGIWNFILNWGALAQYTSGAPPEPINKIRLGPIHTLHKRGGKLAAEGLWYEPNYSSTRSTFDISTVDWQKIKGTERWIRDKIKKQSYSQDLIDAIVRYGRTLDNRDLHAAFLGLWTVLEFLTDTGKSAYSETARRAAFVYEERDLYRQLVKNLADFRNRYVHVIANSPDIETLVYQLKGVTEQLLDFYIRNVFKFQSIGEASSFLQSPYKLDDINKGIESSRYRIRQYENARTFRGL